MDSSHQNKFSFGCNCILLISVSILLALLYLGNTDVPEYVTYTTKLKQQSHNDKNIPVHTENKYYNKTIANQPTIPPTIKLTLEPTIPLSISDISSVSSHICIDGNGIYSPLMHNYFHKFYNYSILYNFLCPYNSSITSINNTITHIKFHQNIKYFTYIPYVIQFNAYDIHNQSQQFGGDEFIIYAKHNSTDKYAFQAFQVEDLFNGSYNIHFLLSLSATYEIYIMHKYSCFESMINRRDPYFSMMFLFLTIINVSNNPLKWNKTTKCSSDEQHGIDMIASGMWIDDNKWDSYCCKRPSLYWPRLNKLNYIKYILGDSTLTGRNIMMGYPDDKILDLYKNQTYNNSLNTDNDNKSIIIVTNINLHPLIRISNLNEACNVSIKFICDLIYYASIYHNNVKNEINVVIVGGTSIHEWLFQEKHDLITEYRTRWHDECIKEKLNKINNFKNISMCYNSTIDNVIHNLKKKIYFVNISNMRIGRWDVNIKLRPHDKIHGFLRPTQQFYTQVMHIRSITNDGSL